MTQDEIIEMARQAGYHLGIAKHDIELLETFAKLVAAKEREACAKVCEYNFSDGALIIAEAIRARGEA